MPRRIYIVKVTSDEVENGNGDGNTLNDIVILLLTASPGSAPQ